MPRPFPSLALAALLLALPGCMKAADSGSPSGSPNAPSGPLSCRLETVPPLQAGGPAKVRFTLTNDSRETLWVLRWNTPLEERWKGTIFVVTRDGQEVSYQGPMTKRGDPTRDEYAELPAGGTVSGEADLAQVYDLKTPGTYRLEIAGRLADVTNDGKAVPRARDLLHAEGVECGTDLRLTP